MMNANLFLPGALWQHFKGHKYQIIGLFKHSETQELMVGYLPIDKSLADEPGWVRPFSMWDDHIERGAYSGPRFKPITG